MRLLEPLIGISGSRNYRGRHPGNRRPLLLDGHAVLADVDLDASGLLPLLVEVITQDRGGDGERADDEVENVAINRPGVLFVLP